jgi:signal transduction histidine kinase
VVPVVDRGDQLGAVMVEMPAGRAARPQDRRLLQDLADQAAIAFRNARLSAELAGQVARLSGRTRELAASRRRVVTAADGERRRLERSIAREVVPHLQPLPARLDELARGAEPPSPGAAEPLLAAADAALDALREITRGVFPSQLSRSGLEPALSSLLARSGTGLLVVDPSAAGQRLDPRVEAAAYFCVVEASRDLDPPIEVTLGVPDGRLRVAISGRERGELTVAVLRDRVEAAGGTVTGRRAGEAMIVEVDLPTATAGVAS